MWMKIWKIKVYNINYLILGNVNVHSCSQFMNENDLSKKGTVSEKLGFGKAIRHSNGIIPN